MLRRSGAYTLRCAAATASPRRTSPGASSARRNGRETDEAFPGKVRAQRYRVAAQAARTIFVCAACSPCFALGREALMYCASCKTDSRFVNGMCSGCGAVHNHEQPATKDTWASTLKKVRLPIRGTSHSCTFAAPPLTRAKARRSSFAVAAIATGVLLVVLTLTWFVLAERTIRTEVSRFESALLVVEKARRSSFDDRSRPLNAIEFNDLTGYVETFDRKKADLTAAIDRLAEGSGMGIWTEGRRNALVSDFNGRLRLENERSEASRSALDAERSRHGLVLAAVEDGGARRTRAARALMPETDENGYNSELASLAKVSPMSIECGWTSSGPRRRTTSATLSASPWRRSSKPNGWP